MPTVGGGCCEFGMLQVHHADATLYLISCLVHPDMLRRSVLLAWPPCYLLTANLMTLSEEKLGLDMRT